MGKLRVYDAYLSSGRRAQGDLYWSESTQTTLRGGVSIDPIANTAKEHHLFIHEVVTANSVFVFVLEADRVTEEELTTLLGLLQGWDGSMETAIGKGRSRGWGRIRWSGTPTVEAVTDEAVRRWMEKGTDPFPPLSPIKSSVGSLGRETDVRRIGFSITPSSPILVNDPGRVGEKDPHDDENHVPDLEFTRTADGQAMLPGSSLRGVLRAHAGRILATIAHQHYDAVPADAREIVRPLVEQLFGTEGRRSLVWVGDATAEETRPHHQTFNAVDRFIGGVAKTALYSVAAAECKSLTGTCAIDLHPLWVAKNSDWWKGLLLLAARDFMDGDLMLGWGKARGFGKASLVIEANDGSRTERFEDLLALLEKEFGDTEPLAWIEELHDRIAEQVRTPGEER